MKTIFYGIILYLIVMFIFYLLEAFIKIRSAMTKRCLGIVDILTGYIALQIWNHFFRAAEVISSALFWTVFIALCIPCIVGCVRVAVSLFSADVRRR